ncbi:MAG: hypothetical protein HKN92_00140 [Chitinophagales bacterium]|nr:hypothetical protein [Chitinophagales bacterium]
MKNLKRLGYLVLIVSIGLIASCTKEQLVLKILEGEWDVNSVVVDGVPQPTSSYKDQVYIFDKCDETDEVCYGRIKDESNNSKVEFSYQIGETLDDFTLSYSGNFDEGFIYDVDEHTPTKFIYSFTDTIGSKTTISLDKRD